MKNDFPKVLIVDLSERYGGASARVLTLMQNYPPGKIYLAALDGSPVSLYATDKNLPVILVGKNKFDVRILFNLIRAIRSLKFDIVDVQNIQAKFWGSLSTVLSKATLISTLNSWYLSEHGETNLKGKFYIAIEILTNWTSPHYIVVSRKIYDSLCERGIKPENISLVYNAVDIEEIQHQSTEHKIDIRSKFNIPLNFTICMALGRLVWAKGYENLIQALELLKNTSHNFFCIIIGGGELKPSLLAMIDQSGLADRVILYGHSDHETALSLLKGCDIFVMPSRTEGTPIALLEAAALGLPILSTNVGGIPELLTGNNDALLVPSHSPRELADGLVKLAEDKNLAQTLSQNARSRIRTCFSTEKQLNDTLNAYHSALLH